MSEELFIPKLGQTVEQVTLINWLVKDGDTVSQGQGVLEVETDKAVFTVEATADGIIHLGPFKAGDVLPNLTVVAIIGKAEDQFTAAPTAAPSSTAVMESEKAPEPTPSSEQPELFKPDVTAKEKTFISPRARKLAEEEKVDTNAIAPTGGMGLRIIEKDVRAFLEKSKEIKISPLAERVAQESGLDLHNLVGTGPGGEITRVDVDKAIAQAQAPAQPVITPAAPVIPLAAPPAPSEPLPEGEVLERMPLKGIRALIAERMSTSVHTTARFTLFIEADASKLVQLREKIKANVEKEWGFAPSYNDLIALICAKALRQYPYMNARLALDAIEQLTHVNIGMATDTERGLIVPVIKDADQKNLRQFGTEFRQLVEQARSGRINLNDLQGGTFTITNLGTYDILTFVPVINLPEAAILAVGRITPKPVAVGDAIAIRQMWMLALVVDHRVVDGAPAAKFLQAIKDAVENPDASDWMT